MIHVLKRTTSLQTIRLDAFPLDDISMCKMLGEALETHPGLGDLEIKGGISANPSSVASILQGVVRSPRVSAFKLVSVYPSTRIRPPSPSSPHQDLLPAPSLFFSSTHGLNSTRLLRPKHPRTRIQHPPPRTFTLQPAPKTPLLSYANLQSRPLALHLCPLQNFQTATP